MSDYLSTIKIQCELLCDFLPRGEDRAISFEELGERLGVMPGHAYLLVREAQRQGFKVLETYKGVFIPETDAEKEMYKYYVASLIGGKPDYVE